jgi:hypothetical protein
MMDRVLNDSERGEESDAGEYAKSLNDSISSLESTFWFQLMSAPIKGGRDYLRYTNIGDVEFDAGDMAKASVINTLATTARLLFKEKAVAELFTDTAIAYAKTGNAEFSADVWDRALAKVTEGLGRYQMLPGMDMY